MSAAAVASTAVETAATAAMETIAAVIAAARVSAVVAATDEAVGFTAPVAVTPVTVVAPVSVVSAVAVVAVAIVTAASVEAATIVAAVVPGAGTDEDAAGEVVRSVVAVWSTGVRIVAVVTIGAGRRWPDGAVHRTYSNAHGNLRVSICCGKKENS